MSNPFQLRVGDKCLFKVADIIPCVKKFRKGQENAIVCRHDLMLEKNGITHKYEYITPYEQVDNVTKGAYQWFQIVADFSLGTQVDVVVPPDNPGTDNIVRAHSSMGNAYIATAPATTAQQTEHNGYNLQIQGTLMQSAMESATKIICARIEAYQPDSFISAAEAATEIAELTDLIVTKLADRFSF